MTIDFEVKDRAQLDEAADNVDRLALTVGRDANNHGVLDGVRTWFARFIKTQNSGDLDVLTLWTVHTFLLSVLPCSPRLIIDSLLYGAGKTTTLEHIENLGHETVIASGIGSPALIPRMVSAAGDESITLLIDEADRTLDPKKDGVGDLMAVINSGSKHGATRPVLVPDKDKGWKAEAMPTYCAVAMAGNAPALPDDTRSRSLYVYLLPAYDDDIDETDWVSDDTLTTAAQSLADQIAQWASDNADLVKSMKPHLPEGCKGRTKERWVSLAKIAAVAGSDWPDRVDNLISADLERMKREREDGLTNVPPRALLLPDLLDVFGNLDFMSTTGICEGLARISPERWGAESPYGAPISRQRLTRMLSPMGIHSSKSTGRQNRCRGYRRADIQRMAEAAHLTESTPSNPL